MKFLYILLFVFISVAPYSGMAHSPAFVENKGQITDQYHNTRSDIKFSFVSGGVTLFLGSGGMHHQYNRAITPAGQETQAPPNINNAPAKDVIYEMYRLDVDLIGSNKNAAIKAEEQDPYFEHYYLPQFGENGEKVRSYRKITYQDVYPYIDWTIQVQEGKVEYYFVVREGGDPARIKLRYSGANSLVINDDGDLLVHTPMGTVTETAPVAYQEDGKSIKVLFSLTGNVAGFQLAAYKGTLTIDPYLDWGTYYGDVGGTEYIHRVAYDPAGNVVLGGTTTSINNIATSGSHQETYSAGYDAYVAKFSSSGTRLWATYCGASGYELTFSIVCDSAGSIYIGGNTNSVNSIATTGSHQPVYGGGLGDGFIVKFNSDGVRSWATYLGGSNSENQYGMTVDPAGDLYVTGSTNSAYSISTPGSFQPVYSDSGDAYLVKFDSAGNRLWGTYFGDISNDFSAAVHADATGNVYLGGSTKSIANISTIGAFKASYSDSIDAFIAKFTQQGTLLWATYYGGSGQDVGASITSDMQDNIYISGHTASDTGIATVNAHQQSRGGSHDLFLAKFNSAGGRIWGTYYGGAGYEWSHYDAKNLAIDDSANIYLCGMTPSTTGIATPGSYQSIYGGGDADVFLVKLDSAGNRYWGTYYGGTESEEGGSCAYGANKSIYLAGATRSTTQIATTDGHQPTGGGQLFMDAFLAKFAECIPYQPSITQAGLVLDAGNGFSTYQWYLDGVIITGATNQLYTINQDGYFFAILTDSNGCVNISDTVFYNLGILGVGSNQMSVTLSPNPNDGSFRIYGNIPGSTGNVTYEVMNAVGEIVYKGAWKIVNEQFKKQLSWSNLPAGVYILKLRSTNADRSIKFIKN